LYIFIATVTLANASEAKRAAKLINGQLFKGSRILVNEAPPNQTSTQSSSGTGSSFVVVGNLSFDFTESQFKKLMSPHGEIKNVFLVRGKISKKSKGYGFIEYKHKESATKAKEHFMKTDAKFVDGRIIRVETVASTLAVGEAKHSRTVFVDKLPKMFEDENQLINMFSSAGNVTFCKASRIKFLANIILVLAETLNKIIKANCNQIKCIVIFQLARTKQGQPRGYALIDYSTVVEAERGQQQLDGTPFGDSNIRVSFCTPGKSAQDIFAKFDDSVRY
jgi:RNA recognition motif-containing protein